MSKTAIKCASKIDKKQSTPNSSNPWTIKCTSKIDKKRSSPTSSNFSIIECVPNFSEGKDKRTIKKIAKEIGSVPGISILDIHIDPSHNRSVITFAGEPKSVIEASFKAVKKAGELIDISKHHGEHPRIGATDVIPLVPLKNISFKQCLKYAEILAKKISEELEIPTYLYEKSAKTAERKNLANIRKIGYEKLKNEILKNPKFKPDFGSKKLGQAGATMVGVRDFLIAFNVNLKSDNLSQAKEIAKKIRESNGGLKGVKAIGVNLKHKGVVQVSTNITNYKKIGIKEVFEAIKKEADKRNTEILESEIVGMIPQDALPGNYKKTDFRINVAKFDTKYIIPSALKQVGVVAPHLFCQQKRCGEESPSTTENRNR